MEWTLEVAVVPVSDVDGAIASTAINWASPSATTRIRTSRCFSADVSV